MEGKLKKTGNQFILYSDKKEVLAITEGSKEGRMLSLKNCQAIERGYDLDELANELLYSKYPFHPSNDSGYWLDMYKEGFQKALEILADKMFSEKDVKLAINLAWDDDNLTTIDIIQSLQQTEWDVEIVTKNSRTGKIIKSKSDLEWDEDGLCDVEIPKLDEKGNLILKRK